MTDTPPIAALRAALEVYDVVEGDFRHAVILERQDEKMRRRLETEDLPRPMATAGDADRLGRKLEELLPHLADLTREAIASVALPGRPGKAIRDVTEQIGIGAGGRESIRVLAEQSWRDPWMGGELGAPSPYDPRRPSAPERTT